MALPGAAAQKIYNENVDVESRPKDAGKLKAAIRAHVCGLTDDQLSAALQKKVAVYWTTFKAQQVLYMPAGFIVVDRVGQEQAVGFSL